MLLRHYLSQGMSKAAIARRLSIDERTIRRWIKAGELDRDLDDPPRYAARPQRPSKLDGFKVYIRARLSVYPELTAVRLFEEIRANGYEGGYTQLADFVRRARPRPLPDLVVRFETPAGHQGQVDFAEFDFPWGKRFALLVVLAYSRLLWLRLRPARGGGRRHASVLDRRRRAASAGEGGADLSGLTAAGRGATGLRRDIGKMPTALSAG